MEHRQITVGDASLYLIEAGDPAAPPVLFLHGWPQDASSWAPVLELAAPTHHAIAVDLPGIGRSTGATDGTKRAVAEVVRLLVEQLGLRRLTLVGHDAGGMVAYAYLRRFYDLGHAVIMDTVVPGVAPWEDVLRAAAVAAYRGPALKAGFDLYRALPRDAADNELSAADGPAPTPLLYLRGEHEPGDLDAYLKGFAAAGVTDVEAAVVPGAGRFAPTENPRAVWELISGRQ